MIVESLPHFDLLTCLICMLVGGLIVTFLQWVLKTGAFIRFSSYLARLPSWLFMLILIIFVIWFYIVILFFSYLLGIPLEDLAVDRVITALAWCM